MTDYLKSAADLLAKAAEDNERWSFKTTVIEGRERIAMKYAQLAAIERGLIPTDMVGDLLAQIARSEVPR
ncbi:hypothetical protein [Actinoplanes sp. NPDC089786]|uniref:hypothetical protein n=1 Tax=Actinoplanes sp. NPDC089786 TaxID=3155185 RepID=UPI0034191945